MYLYITINEENILQSWSKTRNADNEIEVEVADDHPVLTTHFRYFEYLDGEIVKVEDVMLNHAKAKKDDELNKACEDAILAGFLHTINGVDYWFSYDDKAQTNFGDAKDALKEGMVPKVPWTVRIGGKGGPYSRIYIDLPTMQGLAMAILIHKTDKISHYRDTLMPIVDDIKITTTLEDALEKVKEVVW